MNEENIAVSISVSVPLKSIANLLCSALEGGINYWAEITGRTAPRTLVYSLERLSGNDDDQIYPHIDYPLNEGGSIRIRDVEARRSRTLDRAALEHGLKVMAEKFPQHFADMLAENDDAITGDVFVQCCIFGDVIYG